MNGLKNFKLGLTVFLGLVFGISGFFKSDQANRIQLPSEKSISSIENSSVEMCQAGNPEKNAALFVSCGGFLE